MLLTIERVARLKAVDIFAGTPSYILASIARICEEVDCPKGMTFIHEGDPGDCMYVVLDGEVRVHCGEQVIGVHGPGKTVGELAVLDPRPRVASVTAITDTFLLRIAKEPFDEVMADRPEIAAGLIRVLVQRLREQTLLFAGNSPTSSGAPSS